MIRLPVIELRWRRLTAAELACLLGGELLVIAGTILRWPS